jgi:hypothetical protein
MAARERSDGLLLASPSHVIVHNIDTPTTSKMKGDGCSGTLFAVRLRRYEIYVQSKRRYEIYV